MKRLGWRFILVAYFQGRMFVKNDFDMPSSGPGLMYIIIPRLLLLATLVLWVGSANAKNIEGCFTHTWKGTVGVVPVMIELKAYQVGQEDNEVIAGRYYYRVSPEDLLLVKDKHRVPRWKEIDPNGKTTGYLTLACRGDSLTGEWRSPDGKRFQTIAARRVADDSYQKPRENAAVAVVVAHKTFESFHYDLFNIKGYYAQPGIILIGKSKGINKINEKLRAAFLGAIDGDMSCRAIGRISSGESDQYRTGNGVDSSSEVVAWNGDFVVINNEWIEECSAAIPNYGQYGNYYSGGITYDLQTGKEENVSLWLIEKYRKTISLKSSLGKIILKLYRPNGTERDDDCRDTEELSGVNVWPTSRGMVFQTIPPPSFQGRQCLEDVLVPYNKVFPYLSPRGKLAVRSFQGH